MDCFTDKEVREIREFVRNRDQNRCIVHGTLGAEVHEILQRSSSCKNAKSIFQPRFMACVCPTCHLAIHSGAKKVEIDKKLLTILRRRFGYKYSKGELKCYQMY